MSRRAPQRSGLSAEAIGHIRSAFEPRYKRALPDEEVGEIADNLRRFNDVLASWELEDRARALLAPGSADGDRDANPPARSPDAP